MLSGVFVCIALGTIIITIFHLFKTDIVSQYEYIWTAVFGLISCWIITLMGAALLRVSKMKDKWRVKIAAALEANESGGSSENSEGLKGLRAFGEKYAMFLLPFVTVLREGLEGVVFIIGVGLGLPASSFPLAVISGLGVGAVIGYMLYRCVILRFIVGGMADTLQRRQCELSAGVPRCVDMLSVPDCCWSAEQICMVSGELHGKCIQAGCIKHFAHHV